MSRHLRAHEASPSGITPVGAAGRGLFAGMAGTLTLSLVSRVLPGMRMMRHGTVDRWEARSVATSMAPALTLPQSPGPEGLAEQFAYKVGSGVFGRDLVPYTRLAGRACHVAYGAAWGMLYGMWQASYPVSPALAGPLYGVLVWTVGPAVLVPGMQLVERPTEMSPDRAASLLAGHVAYGITLALTFRAVGKDGR